ncbi:MAG: DUF2911 domain-containing protein [Saprospiraceae bacterium]|nr:DUF2911 domain-containing protein [Saprospiraceae bacterium]
MRLLLSIAFILTLSITTMSAQKFPDVDKSPMDMAYYPSRVAFRAFGKTDEEKNVKPLIRVVYSRPMKNGRVVFGELQKYGEVWRVGANESTEIQFFQDVTINGKKVKAGRYTLYATPNKDSWEVFINTDLDNWGHYAYNAEHNVASIKVPTKKTESTVEAMAIMFEKADKGANMLIAWDDTMVSVPIEF